MKFGIGQPARRVEDERFITGKGSYTADLVFDNQVHAVFLRSPHAHARIASINTAPAKGAEGVVGVWTSEDTQSLGPLASPVVPMLQNIDGSQMIEPRRPLLAEGMVRYVGEPVAMIAAATRNQALDAAELIEVEYEDIPSVTDTAKATESGAPQVHEAVKDNLLLDWAMGDEESLNKAFAEAAHITKLSLINNRVVANAMEPRAAVGLFEDGNYTLRFGGQGVHLPRMMIAGILGISPENLRAVTEDVGGGFGMKAFIYNEYPLVLFAAKELGRPVKWVASRAESFLSDVQGRDHVTEAQLAMDKDGKFLGVRVDTTANVGAYLSQYGPLIPTAAPAGMHVGVYGIKALYNHVRVVTTNSVPLDAYRGAGRPEASYVIERLVDQAARELGMGSAELRRRNFVPTSQFGETEGATLPFDSGDFANLQEKALKKANIEGFAARKEESSKRGKKRGFGISYYVERTMGAPEQTARIVVNGAENRLDIYAGTGSTGQGHETVWAQLASEKMGVPMEQIKVHTGDTAMLTAGGGTGGSSSLYMAAGAISDAGNKIIELGCENAAPALNAAPEDIEYRPGDDDGKEPAFGVKGTDRLVSLYELARRSPEDKPLDHEAAHSMPNGNHSFPNGCHVCEVEIDEATGKLDIVRYTALDDFGNIMNPLLAAGQVHGGIVQGVGQAIGEEAVYDSETGQLITGSYMDYFMPRADDFPMMDIGFHEEAPCALNPLGAKGCGEAGTVGALAVVVNAAIDALGVEKLDMPLTPAKLYKAMHGG